MLDYLAYTDYTHFPCHLSRLKWLVNIISETHNKEKKVKILDIGCGTGNVTIPLGLIENSEVLGIDIHQPTLNIAVEKNSLPNVKFKFEYLQNCNINDYDYIILTEVLEHIDNYQAILEYIAMHAKKDMSLLITIPNGFGPFEISQQPLYLMRKIGLSPLINTVKRLLGKKEPYSLNYEKPHVNFFTIRSLRKALIRNGMVITRFKKAYVFAPIIETYLPFIPLDTIAKIDNTLAQILPAFIVSGWYFKINKINSLNLLL
ncbi:MAG: class I SAM-dependent methyltransferase [bacterium]